jgi:O-antigen/teichoic acid export membrane protein
MASVKKNFAFNVLLVISNIVFPILVFPYIARILGPKGLGDAHFALQFSKWFVTIASLGIPIYGLREVAKVKNNKVKLGKLVSELLALNVLTACLSTLVYLLALGFSNTLQQNMLLFAVAGLQVALGFLSIDWLFYGLEDFRIITYRALSVRIVTVCFLVWFINSPDDVFPYLLISIISIAVAHLWNLFYAFSRVELSFKSLQIIHHLKPIMLIFLMNICITMYTVFDTVWVGFLSTSAAVGLYTSATKLSKVSIPLVSALGTVLMPRSARTFAANITNPQHLQTSFNFIVDMAIPIAVGICLLTPELLTLFSGIAFLGATTAMRILSVLPLCIGLNNLFGMQILSASGNDKLLLWSVFLGMLVNMALNILLVPHLAHTGAAIAITITEVTVTLVTFYLSWIKFSIRFNFSRIPKTLALTLLFIPLVFFVKMLHVGNLLTVCLSVLLCINAYVWIQYLVFKNEFMLHAFSIIKSKIQS